MNIVADDQHTLLDKLIWNCSQLEIFFCANVHIRKVLMIILGSRHKKGKKVRTPIQPTET